MKTVHLIISGVLALGVTTPVFAAKVPEKRIPPSVLLEVHVVESEFNAALADDCAVDRCYSKGCVYEDHITLDQARTTSLPGLPAEKGPGSAVAQNYLTRVRCSFAHEKNIEAGDVRKLAQRLRRRLSSGWLTVAISPSSLDPIPKSLLDSEPEATEEDVVEEDPLPPEVPSELTGELALQQLWNRLLPHFPWMLAIGFLTFAILMLIWAARRLGAQSLEERLLEAQLLNAQGKEPAEEEPTPELVVEALPSEEEDAFADEQEADWKARLDTMVQDDDVISRLLREWLKAGDYPTLARALLVFGDRVTSAFDDAPDIALRKVEFATYFRDVDTETLPSRPKFFRRLNQQAMASLLLSQKDVHLYRSLREDFGASGVVGLSKELPTRYAALLFALVAEDQQQETAALLTPELRLQVAAELLASTRIALTESDYLTKCVDAVSAGENPPPPPVATTSREHGPPIDSAGALSRLLPHIGTEDRAALFNDVLKRHAGSVPLWFEDIVFNHMLTALPDETRNDLVLEVDIRGLAAWLQMQPQQWRKAFIAELSRPLQNALEQNAAAPTRAELIKWSKRGHKGLVAAFKGTYARRGIRFVDLVA